MVPNFWFSPTVAKILHDLSTKSISWEAQGLYTPQVIPYGLSMDCTCIPHAALFSLVTPSCPLYYYYLIYITCIIRNQYNPLFFLHIIPIVILWVFIKFCRVPRKTSSSGVQVKFTWTPGVFSTNMQVKLWFRWSPSGVQEFTWSPVESTWTPWGSVKYWWQQQ